MAELLPLKGFSYIKDHTSNGHASVILSYINLTFYLHATKISRIMTKVPHFTDTQSLARDTP